MKENDLFEISKKYPLNEGDTFLLQGKPVAVEAVIDCHVVYNEAEDATHLSEFSWNAGEKSWELK